MSHIIQEDSNTGRLTTSKVKAITHLANGGQHLPIFPRDFTLTFTDMLRQAYEIDYGMPNIYTLTRRNINLQWRTWSGDHSKWVTMSNIMVKTIGIPTPNLDGSMASSFTI
ncbi:hypothetical protein K449DRAFT_204698 [Hypoxylon sp. EC38]|nr:hypothetical protein K449DRAFT_204698 [Hypoxylon sp. EC38]